MRGEFALERSTGELRAAWIEDSEVVELDIARDPQTNTGAIHRARVTARTEDGGAFLDLGAGASGFMPRAGKTLGEGAYLAVQLGPEPVETGKTRVVSSRPGIAGRYLALRPGARGADVCKKTSDLQARCADVVTAIPDIVAAYRVILNTPAARVPLDAVLAEAKALADQAAKLGEADGGPGEVLAAPDALYRMLRDVPAEPAAVHLCEPALLAEARRRAALWPDILEALTLWRGREPVFEALGAEDALDSALAGAIDLPSGGRITLEETQAASVIDVDAGATGSRGPQGRMRLTANLEAVAAVARLLRLAGIGGLVVVDFIDPSNRRDRGRILAALDDALARDRLPVQRSGMNAHGIVSLTRPRRRVPLRERLLDRRLPQRSLETRALAFLRRAEREATAARPGPISLEAERELVDWIVRRGYLETLRARVGRPVRLESKEGTGSGRAPNLRRST